MKVSELMWRLDQVLRRHGDLEVGIAVYDFRTVPDETEPGSVKLRAVETGSVKAGSVDVRDLKVIIKQ